ncbi:MAG: TonB-dependent receptor [Sphingobacteriales bacterium]|nr:TonB-dependent receptor [Sphingobacteriales bacterium]
MTKTLLPAIITLLFGFNATAQDLPGYVPDSNFNKEQQLAEVIITANRSERKMGNVAVPVQLISQKTIRQTGSLRLQDILQEQTGLVIVNSSLGSALNGYPNPFGQGVQMLGLDPAYTLILIDGEPLIGRNGGILKLGRLGTGNIRQIEIVKGPSSSLYGSEAMAGVINIITQSPLKATAEVQIHRATNNTWGTGLSYGNRFNKTGIQLFINRYSSSGYDLDKTIYGKTVDPFREWNGQLKVAHDFSNKLQLLASLRQFDSKQNNDYQILWQNQPAVAKGYTKEKDQSAFVQLRWQVKPEHRFYFRTFYDHYRNNSFVNLDKTTTRFDETSFDQSILKPELQFESKHKTNNYVAGAGAYFEMIDASRYAGKRNLTTLYAFTQKEWSLLHDKFTLIAGGRIDKRSDFAAKISPRIAVAFKPGSKWKFTASSGWGFKAPDFRHLYLSFYNSQIGYSLIGAKELSSQLQQLQQQGLLQPGADINPYLKENDLKPETSFGSHIGAKFNGDKWNMEAGLFRNDIQNLIESFSLTFNRSNGQPIFSYHNIGKVYTRGVELNIKYRLVKTISFSAGYQFLDAKDKDVLKKIDEGKLYKRDLNTYVTSPVKHSDYFGLFNRSKHTANFKVEYNDGKTGWNIYARAVYRGQFGFTDLNGNNIADDPAEMVSGFWMTNFAVSKSFLHCFSTQCGVENLLNYTNPARLSNIAGRLFFINLNYSLANNNNKHKQHQK